MTRKYLLYCITSTLVLSLSYSVVFVLDNHSIISLAKEDGFFETLSAVLFLVASIFFFLRFRKDKTGNDFLFFTTKRNYFFLVLGIVFFLGFGEEISWGQRIFDLKTPEMLEEINLQNEINIHNISIFHGKTEAGDEKSFWAKLLNIDRLFSLFWFTFCVFIPLITKASITILRWLRRINMPIIPIWIGIFFMANYLISKVIESSTPAIVQHSIVEIKECNTALLFLLVSFYLYRTLEKKISA